jgi:heat shock protein HslJ
VTRRTEHGLEIERETRMRRMTARLHPGRFPALLAAILPVLTAACAPAPPAPAAPGPEGGAGAALPATYVYQCEGDYRFSVTVMPDRVALRAGGNNTELPRVIAASGTRYSNGSITFWSKGLQAQLETPEAAHRSCVGQLARTPADEARILASGGGAPLTDVRWTLSELAGAPALPDRSGALPYLDFAQQGATLTGSGGCNLLSGRYSAQGDLLHVNQGLIMTRRACVDPALQRQEQAFVDALQRTDRFRIWGTTLTLLSGTEVVARFTTGA